MSCFINKLLLFILFCGGCQCSYANGDTTWLSSRWKPAGRSNAAYYVIASPQDALWKQTMYFAGSNKLYMQGASKNKNGKQRTGIYTWYDQQGTLTDSVVYDNDVPVSQILLYSNGQRRTVLLHDKNYHAVFVNSWYMNGSESVIDTFYYSNYGHSCNKDTANLKGVINKENDVWHLRFYDHETGKLAMNGYFKERLCKTRIGINTYYYKNGSRDSVIIDNNGKYKEGYFYHENGQPSAVEKYDDDRKLSKATYWDDAGNKLKLIEKDMWPKPVSYMYNWRQDLAHRVNGDNSIDTAARKSMTGNTELTVLINEEGKLLQATVSKLSAFAAMDSLILKTFRQYNLWTPYLKHGRKSNFMSHLHLAFKEGRLKEEIL